MVRIFTFLEIEGKPFSKQTKNPQGLSIAEWHNSVTKISRPYI